MMIEILEITKDYSWAVSVLFAILSGMMFSWGKERFATKATQTAFYEHKAETDKRLVKIETTLADIPTNKEIHELTLEICNLTGELKRVDQKMDGLDGLVDRVEKQVTRIDQFLRSKQR